MYVHELIQISGAVSGEMTTTDKLSNTVDTFDYDKLVRVKIELIFCYIFRKHENIPSNIITVFI